MYVMVAIVRDRVIRIQPWSSWAGCVKRKMTDWSNSARIV
jgi:hypothetical protein